MKLNIKIQFLYFDTEQRIMSYTRHRLCIKKTLILFISFIYCSNGVDYGMRIDLLPPCIENENNSARFGVLAVRRLLNNQFKLNGTLIVDRTIDGPLEVSIFY